MLPELFLATFVASLVMLLVMIPLGFFRKETPNWRLRVIVVVSLYLGCGAGVTMIHWLLS